MTGFTKLFSSLVYSTVWREEMHVKVVWITMLALADRNGVVPVSRPGLADAARVSLEQCKDALRILSNPDPDSRTREHEGRRIEEVDGGYRLLNYMKYRELRDEDERRIQTREAVRRHRAKVKKGKTIADTKAAVSDVSKESHASQSKPNAEAEAEAEADKIKSTLPAREAEGSRAAELELAKLLTEEQREPVRAFLATRPAETKRRWFSELLRLIGPATGAVPDDLAAACRDALLADPPVTSAMVLGTFVTKRRDLRRAEAVPRLARPGDVRNGRPPNVPYSTAGNELARKRLERAEQQEREEGTL